MSPQPSYSGKDLRRIVGGSQRAHQALQDAVLRLLALCGLPAIPVHTGPRVSIDERGTVSLRGNAAQRGLSDVLTCLPPTGRLALLELKTGDARRSPAQRELHQRFTEAGALCLVVRNAAELLHQLGLTGRIALPRIPVLEAAGGPGPVDAAEAERFARTCARLKSLKLNPAIRGR